MGGGLVGDIGGMESRWHRCVRFKFFARLMAMQRRFTDSHPQELLVSVNSLVQIGSALLLSWWRTDRDKWW